VPADATPAREPLLCPNDGWAILADPPGYRDLVQPHYWAASLERSRRRRHMRRQPRVLAHGRARLSLALATAAISGPAAGFASADVAVGRSAALGSVDLARGARGAAVRELQRKLGITADGIFGPQTEQAVRSFQRAHNVPATGLVGPLTRAALAQSGGPSTQTAPDPSQTVSTLPAAAVRAMQSKLGVTADGVIGPQTRAALRSFEASHGLTADGKPDGDALKALGVDPQAAGSPTTTAPAPSAKGQSAVAAALSKVGSPYRYGAAGPNSFDCSGLVMWALRQAGVSVPHSSYAQYGLGTAVAPNAIQAGDLIFFNTAGAGASDVGLATGPSTGVSATTHGVMTHPIRSGYWGAHFVGARRLG
jgi:peptidoglycan DL-endopeptidase CwlO